MLWLKIGIQTKRRPGKSAISRLDQAGDFGPGGVISDDEMKGGLIACLPAIVGS